MKRTILGTNSRAGSASRKADPSLSKADASSIWHEDDLAVQFHGFDATDPARSRKEAIACERMLACVLLSMIASGLLVFAGTVGALATG